MDSLIPYAFGGIFSIGGILILGGAIKALLGAARAKSWPRADAKLVSSSVRTHSALVKAGRTISGKSFEPVVNYTYAVDGKTYSGNKIGITSISGAKSRAEDALERIKALSPFRILYNPSKPENSLIEAKAPGAGISIVLGVFCLAVGLIALVAGPAFLAFFKS